MLVQNEPMPPLETEELDKVYALPYMRTYHPSYEALGGVPGIEEVRFSITHNRGCYGGCNFCSIQFHQGRYVTSRSKESIIREAKLVTQMPDLRDISTISAALRLISAGRPVIFSLPTGFARAKNALLPSRAQIL